MVRGERDREGSGRKGLKRCNRRRMGEGVEVVQHSVVQRCIALHLGEGGGATARARVDVESGRVLFMAFISRAEERGRRSARNEGIFGGHACRAGATAHGALQRRSVGLADPMPNRTGVAS